MRAGVLSPEAEAIITISSLTKVYGGFRAVDDVTFDARPGRVTGFLGPNGAGKSTTMRTTPWACASGSASRRRGSASPRC